MKQFMSDDFVEPSDEDLLKIEREYPSEPGLDVSCPRCKVSFNLLSARFVSSDPECPYCGYGWEGNY